MKKLVFLLSALSLMACNKNEDNEKEVKPSSYELSNWAMMKEIEFSVPKDSVAVVSVNGVTVAEIVGPENHAIARVPAWAKASDGLRADYELADFKYDVQYIPMAGDQVTNYSDQATIAFEDLRTQIDADYNDFIVEVKTLTSLEESNDKGFYDVYVEFQKISPIAMGAEYNMAFGCEIVAFYSNGTIQRKDVVLSENVRTEYFGGINKMLNTIKPGPTNGYVSDGPSIKTSAKSITDKVVAQFEGKPAKVELIYYIDVFNTQQRHYAVAVAETANNGMYKLGFDGEFVGEIAGEEAEYALGLYLPAVLSARENPLNPFLYLKEKESIFDAYPNFGDWLKGSFDGNPFANVQEDYVYNK